MACFIVPAAEAIVVTAAAFAMKKKEEKFVLPKPEEGKKSPLQTAGQKLAWSRKLSWLANLLWGGVLLLAFEHLWHGEIVPWPPFLTAMGSAESTAVMLHEMATVGVTMAVLVTAVWGIAVMVAQIKTKKCSTPQSLDNAG